MMKPTIGIGTVLPTYGEVVGIVTDGVLIKNHGQQFKISLKEAEKALDK